MVLDYLHAFTIIDITAGKYKDNKQFIGTFIDSKDAYLYNAYHTHIYKNTLQ